MATVQEILDTDIPRPTWALRPGYQAPLPAKVDFTRTSAKWTLDPSKGLYTPVPSGEHRVFGSQQSLLIEGKPRKNCVDWSSDLSQWSDPSGVVGTAAQSVIDGESAYRVGGTDRVESNAGVTSSSKETISVFVEEDTASKIRIVWKDTSLSASDEVAVDFDFGADSFATHDERGGTLGTPEFHEVSPNGFEGSRILKLDIPVTPDASGNTRKIRIYGNAETGSGETIIHHVQLEEAANSTSPIVTNSSQVYRGGDQLDIDVSSLINNEFTIFVEGLIPVYGEDSNARTIINFGGTVRVLFYWNWSNNSYDVNVNQSTSNINIGGACSAFKSVKIAVSGSKNITRLSVNGQNDNEEPADGNIPTFLSLKAIFRYRKISVTPYLLPFDTLNVFTS